MYQKPRKVVVPVAGLGTRFLPVTKVLPKELLPLVDTPIVHWIVEEAVASGLETVIFITSRQKVLIEDYFDPQDLASFKLKQSGKEHLLEKVEALAKKIDIVSLRQPEPLGLGHAILQAAPVLGREPFAVMLGDDLILGDDNNPGMGQCLNVFRDHPEASVVGVDVVPDDQRHLYGIVDPGKSLGNRVVEAKSFIEKPVASKAPSNLALIGRYVFQPEILDCLTRTKPGRNGEIQLTDAMQELAKTQPFFAVKIDGERHDTGDRLGYIKANVSFALKHKDTQLKESLREWLKDLAKTLS